MEEIKNLQKLTVDRLKMEKHEQEYKTALYYENLFLNDREFTFSKKYEEMLQEIKKHVLASDEPSLRLYFICDELIPLFERNGFKVDRTNSKHYEFMCLDPTKHASQTCRHGYKIINNFYKISW